MHFFDLFLQKNIIAPSEQSFLYLVPGPIIYYYVEVYDLRFFETHFRVLHDIFLRNWEHLHSPVDEEIYLSVLGRGGIFFGITQ